MKYNNQEFKILCGQVDGWGEFGFNNIPEEFNIECYDTFIKENDDK